MSKRHQKNNTAANGFRTFGLSDEVNEGIARLGYRVRKTEIAAAATSPIFVKQTPTPVQRKALPVILTGVDAVVMARTGSGKTAAFLIPLVEMLLQQQSQPQSMSQQGVRSVILSPTRELSQQTLRFLRKLAPSINAIGIHGGETMERQFTNLASRPDVIVATPGRLAHHVTEIPDFTLHSVNMLILDEADRLLEQGLAAQIRQIAQAMPNRTQKVLLSATLPKVLVEFTRTGYFCAMDPTVVRLDSEATVSDELRMAFLTCRSAEKDAALLHLMGHLRKDTEENKAIRTGLTLIFAATRHHVEYICTLLRTGGVEDVTMIYGSMDQLARQRNLQLFRKGTNPVLVVTDVAARGIDVPLIDHVIHYHFCPTPKLFVHRSGRAARAGRIGYCWSMVEPDELPYMMDLLLFLGRKPATSDKSYTLAEMTPDHVHYGALPESLTEVETVSRLLHSELTGTDNAESLRSLTRVCRNAMQQYRKTRPEASREAVRRAKALLEGRRLDTGQRVDHSVIPPHPLFLTSTSSDEQKRHEFLQAVSNFRPKETVFETMANKNKDTAVVSHIDKGRTTANTSSSRAENSLLAMKNMRRQMRMVRDRGMVVAGSNAADTASEAKDEQDRQLPPEEQDAIVDAKPISSVDRLLLAKQNDHAPVEGKRRLSKAERKRRKKNPNATEPLPPATLASTTSTPVSFRDPEFFIDHAVESEHSRRVEAAMHTNVATNTRAVRIEEAMLDIVGDENDQFVKKHRMMRWDKAKRKYVQTTVGEELNGESKTKKLRLESGQLVRGSKLKLGDLYQKWQKKTNKSVGRNGVFDDAVAASDEVGAVAEPSTDTGKKGKKGRIPSHKSDIKTGTEIKKERERKQQLKLKNMNKSDRRKIESRGRSGAGQKSPGSQGRKGGKKR